MRQEKAFSKGGAYSFVLDSNLLLHRQVTRQGQEVFLDWLKRIPPSTTVSILDLARGGAPVSISGMMQAFPQVCFNYTGIDINPDQVDAARAFEFPDNVLPSELIEGNAWDFMDLVAHRQFEIVYSGMNIHHGTPEEIYCLLVQIRTVLKDQGLFLNHDCYRPSSLPYLRRPQTDPANPGESFAMIPDLTLARYGVAQFNFEQASPGSDWRRDFIVQYAQTMRDRGAAEAGVAEVCNHIMTRDYPISIDEMKTVALKAGLKLEVVDLKAEDELLGNYLALVAGIKV